MPAINRLVLAKRRSWRLDSRAVSLRGLASFC